MATRPATGTGFTLLAAVIAGWTTIDAQRAVFRSVIEVVPLTVTVTDARGKYINHLKGSDFTVLEDGVAQSLSFFAAANVAVDLALVVDVSSSMQMNLPLVQRAARGLVQSLQPAGRASVAAVTNRVEILQPLTGERPLLDAAIGSLRAWGDTGLYDGLYVLLKDLAKSRTGAELRKQVLVVLSDGLDTASRLGVEDVRDLAGRAGVNIYAVVMPASLRPVARAARDGQVLQAEHAMRALAQDTGGRAFFPGAARELPAIYAEIGTELLNQYELGYLPSREPGDSRFRRVSVRVENAIARTRSGYYPDSGLRRGPLPADWMLPAIEATRHR